jgi:hypothetical protein
MEHKNETTLSAFVLSKATLEERFEITNPEVEGEVKNQTRNGMTDADLDAYVVDLLSTSANTQVIRQTPQSLEDRRLTQWWHGGSLFTCA